MGLEILNLGGMCSKKNWESEMRKIWTHGRWDVVKGDGHSKPSFVSWQITLSYDIKPKPSRMFLHFKAYFMPWLVWLSGLKSGLQTRGSLVRFPVRADAWVVGQVPGGRCVRVNHTLIFLSLKKKKAYFKRSFCFFKMEADSVSSIFWFVFCLTSDFTLGYGAKWDVIFTTHSPLFPGGDTML